MVQPCQLSIMPSILQANYLLSHLSSYSAKHSSILPSIHLAVHHLADHCLSSKVSVYILLFFLLSVIDQPRISAIHPTIDSIIYLANFHPSNNPCIKPSIHQAIHLSIIRQSIHHNTIHPSGHTWFMNFPYVFEAIIRLTNQLSFSVINPAFRLSSHLFI